MAWYAAAGEECPWNATLGRVSEDTVKRCSCRKYAGLQRGGGVKVKVSVGEKKRRKERKKKKKKRRLALAGASRAGVTIARRVFLADAT